MALVVYDRVLDTGTANTTVSFTLNGTPPTGFQAFSVVGNTNTTYYAATDTSGNWEVGLGTYSTTGPTLTRTTILASSNAGSAETFSGTVTLWGDYPAGKAIYLDASGNSIGLGTPSSLTLTNATGLPISTGVSGLGTGIATFLATPSSANLASAVTGETGSGALVFGTSPTLTTPAITDPVITGTIQEDVYALTDGSTVDIDPANGSIQTLTLTSTGRTLTFTNMVAGEAITLMVNDGTAGTITTWNATFVNNSGAAPTLSTTGYTVVSIWKVSTTVYAAVVGNA